MATRLFLTLLAVLTGLAAQSVPAQARVEASRSAEIRAVMSIAVAQRETHAAAMAAIPVSRRTVEANDGCALAMPEQAWRAAAVLPGIDRARE